MHTKNDILETISVHQDELESSDEEDESDAEISKGEDDDSDDSNGNDENSEDEDDEDDNDDSEDETNREDKVSSNTITQKTKSGGKHIIFDEDEDFENLPIPDSLASGPGPGLDIEDTDSDSDAAPEEVVTTAALKAAIKQDIKLKDENVKARLSVRDARKKTHERNKQQKEEKLQRLKVLESERLPEDLLAAVEAEKAQKQDKRKVAIEKHEGKIKRFKNSKEENGTESDRGVQVRAVIKEMKKYSSVIAKAADFRQQQLYGSDVPRRPSKDARMLKEKLIKGGKHKSVR